MESKKRKRGQAVSAGPNDQVRIQCAIDILNRAIKKKPNDADLYRMRSVNFLKLYDGLDHSQQALQDALKAVELDQGHTASFRTNLADVYMSLDDFDKAQESLSVNLPEEITRDRIKMLEINQTLRQVRYRALTQEYGMPAAYADKYLDVPIFDAIKAFSAGEEMSEDKKDSKSGLNSNEQETVKIKEETVGKPKDVSVSKDSGRGASSSQSSSDSDSEPEVVPVKKRKLIKQELIDLSSSDSSGESKTNLPKKVLSPPAQAFSSESSSDSDDDEPNSRATAVILPLRPPYGPSNDQPNVSTSKLPLLTSQQTQDLLSKISHSACRTLEHCIYISELNRYTNPSGLRDYAACYYDAYSPKMPPNFCPFKCNNDNKLVNTMRNKFIEHHFTSCHVRQESAHHQFQILCDKYLECVRVKSIHEPCKFHLFEKANNDSETNPSTSADSPRLSNEMIEKLISPNICSLDKSLEFFIYVEELQRYVSKDGYNAWIKAYYYQSIKSWQKKLSLCPFKPADGQIHFTDSLNSFVRHFSNCLTRLDYPRQKIIMYCNKFPPKICPAAQVNGIPHFGCLHRFFKSELSDSIEVSLMRSRINCIWIEELNIFTSYGGLIEYVVKTMSYSSGEQYYACPYCQRTSSTASWHKCLKHFSACAKRLSEPSKKISVHCPRDARCNSITEFSLDDKDSHSCHFLANKKFKLSTGSNAGYFMHILSHSPDDWPIKDYCKIRYPASLVKLLTSRTSCEKSPKLGRTIWVAELNGYVSCPTLEQYIAGYHNCGKLMQCPLTGCRYKYIAINQLIYHFLECPKRLTIKEMEIIFD